MRHLSVRPAAGLAAAVTVIGLLAAVALIGPRSAPPTATASDSTPTPIANNDGVLSGVYDLLVDGGANTGLFTCMVRLNHESSADHVQGALQCYWDMADYESPDAPPTWFDVAGEPDLQNPDEPGADGLPGPPPPPPYNIRVPDTLFGQYYPGGDLSCDLHLPGGEPCLALTGCFQDVSVVAGPSVIAKVFISDPQDLGGFTPPNDVGGDGQSHGALDLYYTQSNASCKSGEPKGTPFLAGDAVTIWHVTDKGGTPNTASPWRDANPHNSSDHMRDYDGDGCFDADELDSAYVYGGAGVRCGNEPFNPTDSFDPNSGDLTGVYSVLSRILQADCSDAQDCFNTKTPGVYTSCLAEVRHDTTSHDLIMRAYCYPDNTGTEFNPNAYPGVTGDGFPGAPPPGPDVGGGDYAYGAVTGKHTELTGSFDPSTSTISVAGCFIRAFAPGGEMDVWFEIDVSAHQRPGIATIYLNQDEACANSPSGSPVLSDITFAQQPKGLARDDDQDGVPTSRELGDDAACGLRDPFNKNDYFDVSIPRDGVVDLLGDILGVVNNFQPVGYVAGSPAISGLGTMENYDRPAPMTGSANGWNRGSPDLKIDLLIDVLGVIGQFNPGGCAPLP